MRKLIIVFFLFCSGVNLITAQVADRIIYGTCTKDSLLQLPFRKWFISNYNAYTPDRATIEKINLVKPKELSVQIFFGNWCGDSKRELPRFYKILDAIGIGKQKISLVAVGGNDSLVKQSPGGEEKGKGIFRVPVMIIYKNGKEVNRINEYPVISLEKDFLEIIMEAQYIPNYASFSMLNKWLNEGDMTDVNTNAEGMANQIRNKVANAGELIRLANLWEKQGLKKEALQLLKINYFLFPNTVQVLRSLGESLLQQNEKGQSVLYLELALKENKDPAQFTNLLGLLYKAKGLN